MLWLWRCPWLKSWGVWWFWSSVRVLVEVSVRVVVEVCVVVEVSAVVLVEVSSLCCCQLPPCGTFVRLPSLITRSYDLNLRTNTRYVGVPFPTTCCDRRSCSVRRITSRLVGSSPCICVCAKSYSVFPLRLSACKNWLIFFFFCLLHCCKLSVVAVAFRR